MNVLRLWGSDSSHRVLTTIIAITVVVFAAFFLIGYSHPYSENPDFIEPRLTPVLLFLMMAVVVMAVGVTLWAVISTMRKKGLQGAQANKIPATAISIGVAVATVLIMLVTFTLASTTTINVNGSEYDNAGRLKAADMFVITSIILIVAASTLVAFATLRSQLKNS